MRIKSFVHVCGFYHKTRAPFETGLQTQTLTATYKVKSTNTTRGTLNIQGVKCVRDNCVESVLRNKTTYDTQKRKIDAKKVHDGCAALHALVYFRQSPGSFGCADSHHCEYRGWILRGVVYRNYFFDCDCENSSRSDLISGSIECLVFIFFK